MEIPPMSDINPTLNIPMDDIKIIDANKRKVFDMELPTDSDLQILDDKVIFDSNVVFKNKSNRLKYILFFVFLLICAAIYFL